MTDQAQFTQISYDVADQIATITLDRPDKLNAFTEVMAMELMAAFDLTDADDDVRAVIVTGAGRGFCAGADLSEGGATFDYAQDDPAQHRDRGGLVTLRIFESLKPVIGAINGPAVGIGATMTLPMDVRLCSTHARFGFVFARRGIVPEAASSWFLPRLVGMSQALEWTMTGRIFEAEEALAGGLVRSTHPPDFLKAAAHALAVEIVQNTAPVSIALTRQMLWRLSAADHPMAAHRIDSAAIASRGASQDAVEGVMSFLEKREPHFPLRVSADMPAFFPWWEEQRF